MDFGHDVGPPMRVNYRGFYRGFMDFYDFIIDFYDFIIGLWQQIFTVFKFFQKNFRKFFS